MKKLRIFAALLAVAGVHALAASYSGINWSWTAPTGGPALGGYNVYILANASTVTCTNAVTLANLTGPSATFVQQNKSGLVTATTFQQTPYPAAAECFAVTAVSAAGVEGQPAVAFFDPANFTAPSQVTGLAGKPF